MNNNDYWKNLTFGKFLDSGKMTYSISQPSSYRNRIPYTTAENDRSSVFSTWDLAKLANKKFSIFPDEYYESYAVKTDSLKPCLQQCMKNFLDPDTQDFLVKSYNRAVESLNQHCSPEYFHGFALLVEPEYSIGLHTHDIPEPWPPLSFTYVISSGHNAVHSSLIKTAWEKQELKETYLVDFGKSKEFFMVHNSTHPHGAKRSADDKNTYLYFIFDGVTPKSHITLDTFYEST